jgi:hypothetical protein
MAPEEGFGSLENKVKIRTVFLFVVVFFYGCTTEETVTEISKVELAKKAITENCLAHIDYEIIIDNDAVEIRHKTARAKVSYSKTNRAGVLMLVLGDKRTEELKSIRECASQYMDALLEELFNPERKAGSDQNGTYLAVSD